MLSFWKKEKPWIDVNGKPITKETVGKKRANQVRDNAPKGTDPEIINEAIEEIKSLTQKGIIPIAKKSRKGWW